MHASQQEVWMVGGHNGVELDADAFHALMITHAHASVLHSTTAAILMMPQCMTNKHASKHCSHYTRSNWLMAACAHA